MIKARLKTASVRELLLRRGLSQNNFAQRIAVTRGYCSQLLQGKRCPSPQVRTEIMRELNQPFDVVFEIVPSQSASHGTAS